MLWENIYYFSRKVWNSHACWFKRDSDTFALETCDTTFWQEQVTMLQTTLLVHLSVQNISKHTLPWHTTDSPSDFRLISSLLLFTSLNVSLKKQQLNNDIPTRETQTYQTHNLTCLCARNSCMSTKRRPQSVICVLSVHRISKHSELVSLWALSPSSIVV